ncbi:MAG TPA: hypothetical protein VN716_31335, partial [Vicinamibacterales bacterium]|nr:hypothetical protein [Vicinamibacterales bacterium]
MAAVRIGAPAHLVVRVQVFGLHAVRPGWQTPCDGYPAGASHCRGEPMKRVMIAFAIAATALTPLAAD